MPLCVRPGCCAYRMCRCLYYFCQLSAQKAVARSFTVWVGLFSTHTPTPKSFICLFKGLVAMDVAKEPSGIRRHQPGAQWAPPG